MSETQVAAATKKETVYETVTMEDGTTCAFPGTRKVAKSYEIDEAAGTVTAIFKYRNGAVRRLSSAELNRNTQLTALGHGLVQKVGDESSGETDIDDIVLTTDSILERLRSNDWGIVREAGDSLKGASVVIRAIMEAAATRGKPTTLENVKKFLDGKLEKAKARGEKLSRQELYASFRQTGETAAIIKRMEAEKVTKAAKFNSDDLLGELPG